MEIIGNKPVERLDNVFTRANVCTVPARERQPQPQQLKGVTEMVMMHSLKVSDTVVVRIGKNVITAEVLEVRPDKALVRNTATGREFFTTRIQEVVSRAGSVAGEAMEFVAEQIAEAVAPQVIGQVAAMPELAGVVTQIATPSEAEPQTEAPAEASQAEDSQTEAPAEEPAVARPQKKLSLVNAALEVLKAEGRPMNTRELVKAAVERGLWIPTASKTPEQSLYGAFFLEMKNAGHPRMKKSAERGKFELA
jgi:hypothetical protein